jgi:hypothetical protein
VSPAQQGKYFFVTSAQKCESGRARRNYFFVTAEQACQDAMQIFFCHNHAQVQGAQKFSFVQLFRSLRSKLSFAVRSHPSSSLLVQKFFLRSFFFCRPVSSTQNLFDFCGFLESVALINVMSGRVSYFLEQLFRNLRSTFSALFLQTFTVSFGM